MGLLNAALFLSGLSLAYGANCEDISGAWRNDLGSNMTLHMEQGSDKITGIFVSGVESSEGAQSIASSVSGIVAPVQGGSLLAFNVIFDNGQNIASWAGQCMVCDGKEMLYTTFVLRFLEEPGRNWMSTTINRNIFYRPKDADQIARQQKSMTPDFGLNAKTEGLLGSWNSILGTDDSFAINSGSDSGSWEGVHYPSEGKSGSPLYGLLDGDEHSFAALAFASSSGRRAQTRVQTWAGHIVNLQENVLVTSFLRHSFSSRCNDPLRFVHFGMDNYTLAASMHSEKY